MKILHVLDHSTPYFSGYAFRSNYILKLQKGMGLNPVAVTSPKHKKFSQWKEEIDDLTFYRTNIPQNPFNQFQQRYPFFNEFSLIKLLYKNLGKIYPLEKFNLLHAHSPSLNGIPAYFFGKKHNLPLVYEIRAFWEDAAVNHGTFSEISFKYKLSRRIESYLVKKANAVVTICEGIKRELINRGVSDEKITVIPNGVDTSKFKLLRKNHYLLRKYNLNNEAIIGYIGSFYKYEGVDLLIKAFSQILKNELNVKLILVGGYEEEDNLRKLAKRLYLDDKIIFTGPVPHKEVIDYYSIIDIMVYPRKSMRLTELVTPLKPLEAMSMGKVVLASDVGGHKELIQDGQTGLIFKADDINDLAMAIFTILSNNQLMKRLTLQAREYVEKQRDWKKIIENYIPIYRKLYMGKKEKANYFKG